MTCQINHCMLVGWLSTQQIYTGIHDTDVALVIVVLELGLLRGQSVFLALVYQTRSQKL